MTLTTLLMIITVFLALGIAAFFFFMGLQYRRLQKTFNMSPPKGYVPVKTIQDKNFGICIMVNPFIWHFIILTYLYDPSLEIKTNTEDYEEYCRQIADLFAEDTNTVQFEFDKHLTFADKQIPVYKTLVHGEDPLEGHVILVTMQKDKLLGISCMASQGTYNPLEFENILHKMDSNLSTNPT